MVIIENRANNLEDKKPIIKVICDYCESIIGVEEDELLYGEYGMGYITCPCCGKNTYVDGYEEPVTIDTFEFPRHFEEFLYDEDEVDNHDIEEVIRKGIDYFKSCPNEYVWFCDGRYGFVCLIKNDLGEYEVIVATNYYTGYIDCAGKDLDKTDGEG